MNPSFIIRLLSDFITTIIAMYALFRTYETLIPMRYSYYTTLILLEIFHTFSFVSFSYLFPYQSIGILFLIPVYLLCDLFLFKGSSSNIILIFFMYASLVMFIETLISCFINILHIPIKPDQPPGIYYIRIIIPIMYYMIYKIVIIFYQFFHIYRPLALIIGIYCFQLYFITFIWNPMYSSKPINIIFYIICIFSILNIFLLYNFYTILIKEKKELQLKKENELLIRQYKLLKTEEEELLKLRHDIGNHLLTIDTLLKNGDTKSASLYYKQLESEIKQTNSNSKVLIK